MEIDEMNNHFVEKWLKECNEKKLTVFAMIAMGQDASTEVFGIGINEKEVADVLRRMADKIERKLS